MMADLRKMIVVPLDGSQNATRSIDYVSFIFTPKHNLEVNLLYVLPSLPPILVKDAAMKREERLRLKAIDKKNTEMAQRILADGKQLLVQKGFGEKQAKTAYAAKKIDIPRDICMWAEDKRADAVFISTRGRSRLQAFFMGEISRKLLEYCTVCPIWIVGGVVRSKRALLAVDSSEGALRAVDHAGFLLSGTECEVTLFHSMRDLRRFMPKEVLEEAPELEALWKQKAGEQIGAFMKKAKEMLIQAGFAENRVNTKIVKGSRSAAKDILKEAKAGKFGTIIMGRRGQSAVKAFLMGSVTAKVLEDSGSMTVCIVQ